MPRALFPYRPPSPPKAEGQRALRRGLFLAWLLAASLFLAAGPYPPPAAAEGTVLRVEPQQVSIGQGELADLRILVDRVTNLYAADIRLTFDPNILEVVDLDESQPGIQVKPEEYPYPDNVLRNTADNADGTVWYAVTQVARAPLTGSGAICTVRFRAKALGTSSIEILTDMAGLANDDGLLIDTVVQAGQVTVAATGSSVVPPLPPTRPDTPIAAATATLAAPAATPGVPDYPVPTEDSAQPAPTADRAPATAALPAESYPLPGETNSPVPTASADATISAVPTAADIATATAAAPTAAAVATAAVPPAGEGTAPPAVPPTSGEPPAAIAPPAIPPEPAPLIPKGLFHFLMGALTVGTAGLFVYLWRGRGH